MAKRYGDVRSLRVRNVGTLPLYKPLGVLEKKSYPHVLSASPPRGMVQTRRTPVFVSSLLPQVSRSNALIAVTIKCPTTTIDRFELR